MKYLISYFSGTGNTAYSVNQVAENLSQNGHVVTKVFIGWDALPPLDGIDVILFAFPVLSWSAPNLVRKFIRQLPHGKSMRAAVLSVGGGTKSGDGFGGQALSDVQRTLKRKHYDVFLSHEIYLPENWTQFSNPPDRSVSDRLFDKARIELAGFAQRLMTFEKSVFKVKWFHIAWSSVIAWVYRVVGRRVLAKLFIADEKCVHCGLCASQCPSRTIRMKGSGRGRPEWRLNCEGCNRCINLCPHSAIQMSAGRALLVLASLVATRIWLKPFIISVVTGVWPSDSVFPIKFVIILLEIAVSVAVFLLYFGVFDSLVWHIQQMKLFRRFFLLTWTRRFRRYQAIKGGIREALQT